MIHLAALETTRRVRIGERRAVRAANATVSLSNSTSGECEVHVHASREPHAAPWRTERRGENGERRLRYRQGEREREREKERQRELTLEKEREAVTRSRKRGPHRFFSGEKSFSAASGRRLRVKEKCLRLWRTFLYRVHRTFPLTYPLPIFRLYK